MSRAGRQRLLADFGALPEAYQPAWGLEETTGLAQRASADRLTAVLPLIEKLPGRDTLRVLDIGCAQGYFALAIAHAFAQRERRVEVVGVDNLEDNIRFCEALAGYHGLAVDFRHERFDAGFFERIGDRHFDAVLALNVLHHVSNREGATTAGALVGQLRDRTQILLCELAQPDEALDWVNEWNPADPQLLGGFAFRRRIARFATHLGGPARPLYACSDRLAWVGDRWFEFAQVAERSHPGVPVAFERQRRFFLGAGTLVKEFVGNGRHGDFNRAELEAEARALAVLPGDPTRFPEMLAYADDGDKVWFARTALPGDLASRLVGGRRRLDRDALIRRLLRELARLAECGFHHGDLRWWNVLLAGERLRLIDFGALDREASPLHRVALAAMLHELARRELGLDQPYYASLHPLSDYPPRWRPLVRYLLESPSSAFSHEGALAAFEGRARRGRGRMRLAPDESLLAAVSAEQRAGFARLLEHTDGIERTLGAVESGWRSAFDSRTRDARTEIARLDDHARRLESMLVVARRENEVLAASSQPPLAKLQDNADALATRIAREAADARAEREALVAARDDAARHATELEAALQESQRYVESLRAETQRLADELAAAADERKQWTVAQRDAKAHADSLELALDESHTYASSLQQSLGESQAYASSLEARVAREAADAKSEREALLESQRESATWARSLNAELAESRTYADSLVAQLEREREDARSERAALLAARQQAESHLGELQGALNAVREANAELHTQLEAVQARCLRLQRRFRWARPLWPREP